MRLLRLVFVTAMILSIPSMLWGQWHYQQQFFDGTGVNFNPQGSSTRARGMGNAYLALSDDAAGATWNPAGAAFMKKNQANIEFMSNASTYDVKSTLNGQNYSYDTKDNIFSSFGYVSPLRFYHRDFALGVNYYRMIDLTKEYNINFSDSTGYPIRTEKYFMDFGLDAVKLTAATQIIPELSFGINGNVYIRGFTEDYRQIYPSFDWIVGNDTAAVLFHARNKASFSGINFDFGLQGRSGGLSIGAVVSTPFKLRQEASITNAVVIPDYGEIGNIIDNTHINVDFPLGISGGAAYGIDKATIAADFSFYKFSKSRNTMHPYFADPLYQYSFDPSVPNVEVDPQWKDILQLRVGAEYLFDISSLTIPVRAGYRTDPKVYSDGTIFYFDIANQPPLLLPPGYETTYGHTEFNGDQVKGYIISLGTGMKYKTYNLDISYEYGRAERELRRRFVEVTDFVDNQFVEGQITKDEIQTIKENTSRLNLSISMSF